MIRKLKSGKYRLYSRKVRHPRRGGEARARGAVLQAFEASGKFAGTDVQRYTMPPSNEPPRRILQNEWGLALHVESARAAETRRVLIDFGYTHETINNNLDLLQIDVSKLDAMVLIHGHYDHFGGMVGFLQAHRRKLKPAQPSRMKVGIGPDGMGCAAARLPEEKRSAEMMVDDFQHEQATCFHVKGKGLVVMTSCGHRGVVNTVEAAIKVSGVSKVHAILGGFHLMPMSAEYAQETARAMARFDADCLIPMHCSGENFFDAAKQAMPGRVVRTSTGTRFTFGSA
ncbi:MAG: hypothetical protein A3G81_18095 [Betaproteobacteria bacterium RIFCSPLOWO2_12_FULL_65_14]|nr:MAG: hypothetical protein A3G81_18095 [Betaproteobacteria bacterium RIFCSPLOWO2_12_FULL_65_14]